MNLKFLETFLWVARMRSFSGAAERLNITQAAVSARIASLEQDLGVRLLDRGGREMKLTPEGLIALERAEAIVRLTQKFVEEVSSPASYRGTLRMGVIGTISHSWLVDLIDVARLRYPNVRFEIDNDTSVVIAERVARNELDLGLLMGPVIGENVFNVELCRYVCLWVAAPDFPIRKGRIGLPDLARHPIISFPSASKPHEWLTRLLAPIEVEEPLIHTSNSLAATIRMVKDGIGISTLPAVLVEEELASGALRRLDVAPAFPPLLVHASYVDTGHSLLPGRIAAMAADVAATFSRNACKFMLPPITG